MKPTLSIPSLILLAVFACSSAPITAETQPTETLSTEDYFPLAAGTYWIYEGAVMWTVGSEVKEQSIQWKMEVVKVVPSVHSNGVTAYVLKGHPRDLAWYEEGKERSDYVIIQSGQSRFYYAEVDVLSRLQDENDDLYALVDEDQLFLDIPLLPGKKFCGAKHITLYDGGYCWIVHENQAELDVKGLDATDALTEYSICKGTRPDDSCFGFIPGLGISHYQYNHHGTISHVDVRLAEYYSGSNSTKKLGQDSFLLASMVPAAMVPLNMSLRAPQGRSNLLSCHEEIASSLALLAMTAQMENCCYSGPN